MRHALCLRNSEEASVTRGGGGKEREEGDESEGGVGGRSYRPYRPL